jgi:hypothetical protein
MVTLTSVDMLESMHFLPDATFNRTNATQISPGQLAFMLGIYITYDVVLLIIFGVMVAFSKKQPLKSRGITPFMITTVIFLRVLVTMCTQFDFTCAVPILSGMYAPLT